MKLEIIEKIILYDNNNMSITLTKNVESERYVKYIDMQHYYIYKLINEEKLTIKWMPGLKMLANRMTKTLLTETFKKH